MLKWISWRHSIDDIVKETEEYGLEDENPEDNVDNASSDHEVIVSDPSPEQSVT